MKVLRIVGLMSGTSLDGLDICAATFTFLNDQWTFEIHYTQTVGYNSELQEKLNGIHLSTAEHYALTYHELGRFFGKKVKQFLDETGFQADYISSHGHTVFHQPEKFLTTQIGSPAAITAIVGIPVVADFRTQDVHLGGQGAPLVPIGDLLLFPEYTCCLNLGGIANISIKENGEIKAFDICTANMALNYVIQKVKQLAYDQNGALARTGVAIQDLFLEMNDLPFHKKTPPKSLGKEWFEHELKPLLDKSLEEHEVEDVLNTVCEQIAFQINKTIPPNSSLLITGGGAYHKYLIERISNLSQAEVTVPNSELVEFKEALIFGFLGALRITEQTNVLSSVTGAQTNHSAGCIYLPPLSNNTIQDEV